MKREKAPQTHRTFFMKINIQLFVIKKKLIFQSNTFPFIRIEIDSQKQKKNDFNTKLTIKVLRCCIIYFHTIALGGSRNAIRAISSEY